MWTSWSDLVSAAFSAGFTAPLTNDGLRARMLEHVGVVVGGEQGVDRDRHDAREHRAEERDRPVGAVEHEQQHALLALDAGVPQRRGEAARALVELAVGERARVVDEGGLVRASRVRLEQMPREVERLRRRGHDAGAHPVSPP